MIELSEDTFSKLMAHMNINGFYLNEKLSCDKVVLFNKDEINIFITFKENVHDIVVQNIGTGLTAFFTKRLSGLIEIHNIESLFYWLNL